MGTIIEARFEDIMPGELGFYPAKLLGIIKKASERDALLPCPARESVSVPGKYTHLDGRHRILYRKISGERNVALFLAEFQEDKMTPDDLPDLQKHMYEINNHYIALRWEEADKLAGRLQVKNYNEYYEKLVESYPFIRSIDSFLNFVKEKSRVEQQMLYGLPEIVGLRDC